MNNNQQNNPQEPTERQLAYIKDLGRRTGRSINTAAIKDRWEASRMIDQLKVTLEEGEADLSTPFVVEDWVDGGVRS